MKRGIALGLAALILIFSGCAKTPAHGAEHFYYGPYVEKTVPGSLSMDVKISGLARGKCILPEENGDPSLVKAGFAGVFSETDLRTVYQLNAAERMYPASMTKMMTALLVIENTEDYEEKVLITQEAFEGLTPDASVAYLKKDCFYTVKDLLIGLLIPSGNDAANALAIHISGSVSAFAEKMNERARELGMFNTHFVNPHGLHDAKHYTTVYDLYLLARECEKYRLFKDICTMKTAEVICNHPDGSITGQSYTATNSYVREFVAPPEGVRILGGKTGSTREAGRCLTLITESDSGKLYFAVIGKVNGYDALYTEMNRLLQMIAEYDRKTNKD